MTMPAFPAGNDGGRQIAASQSPPLSPPLSYRRVPVRELRALPVRDNPRLQVLDYRLTTAPGMVGRPRTHGHGAARLSGGYVVSLCVTQDGGEWFLEIQPAPFDETLGRRAPLDFAPQILADVYRTVQRLLIAAEGRAHGQRKGRN